MRIGLTWKSLAVGLVVIVIAIYIAMLINFNGDNDMYGEKVAESEAKVIQVDPMGITVLMGGDAELHGSLREFKPGHPKRFWVENWDSLDDYFVWTVEVPQGGGGYYEVSLIGTGKDSEIEVVTSDGNKISAWVNNGWDKMLRGKWAWEYLGSISDVSARLICSRWDRMIIGSLYLPEGISTIKMRARKVGMDLALYSLELTPVGVREILAEKAKKLRSDTKWLADAKYGVMITWNSAVYPRYGERKPFPKNVEDFNVTAFVNMVMETGARYVIFTATWAEHKFPAPIRSIDEILPGRTSKRDLIGEIADALSVHDIKLILYYHCGHDDAEWWKRTGFNENKSKFIDNWCKIVSEIGQRYGEKLAGWFFDDGCVYYPLNPPFERMAKAAKTGNPNRIICYNSWILPKLTDFQDYFSGEGVDWLMDQSILRYLPKGGNGIFIDGPQKGLQAHCCFPLERGSSWGHIQPNTEIPPPNWEKDEFIKMIKDCIERKLVPSINLEVYEDGTPSPRSLELMRALRKAIWQK